MATSPTVPTPNEAQPVTSSSGLHSVTSSEGSDGGTVVVSPSVTTDSQTPSEGEGDKEDDYICPSSVPPCPPKMTPSPNTPTSSKGIIHCNC